MQVTHLLSIPTASVIGNAANLHSVIVDVLWEPRQGVIITRARRGRALRVPFPYPGLDFPTSITAMHIVEKYT